ncbi:polysaccharide deacetylase [Luteitalea sp. TBR-22]|uniref:polysaccharide deacetylase family protein n=1 Tax=Luteitalea sp. TBR-22 TaxID=2802971 RepID=UPI001AF06129|nr:polysaccharide deacetylase family protein [Luteitalea sp. TBR-22]BCS33200.1 polysaccharide deacetylase [Luteitalea sp. TBR-22]
MADKQAVKQVLLQASRATGLVAAARVATRHGFNVIGFHGVSLADEHRRFPTLFISPATFERRLAFLARQYRIVSLEEALAQHAAGRIGPRQVVLTFDDGFYNFLGAAIPLLKKYGAPATVYTVSNDIETADPMFNLLLRDMVLHAPGPTATGLPHDPAATCDLTSLPARERVVSDVLSAFYARCLDSEARWTYCRTAAAALRVDMDEKIRARYWDRLNAAEVRDVVAQGFDVQLHTHSHRNVVENREVVREEVRRNRAVLERLTRRTVTDFCYPLGLWDKDVWPDLRAEGVRSAVTTRNGPNYPQTPVLALRRYLTGEAMTDLEFEVGLSGLRWLGHALQRPGTRFEASEKRLRYKEQPQLY